MRMTFVVLILGWASAAAAEPLRVGSFDVDASPPIGGPMAYDIAKGIETPLSCRGLVIVGADRPIVLCAVDWIGISSEGHRAFRQALASAAGTSPERVAVHTLHQHDAPWCDFSADQIAQQHGLSLVVFDSPSAREVMRRAALAVADALKTARPVTHLGLGEGTVERVASNRRILGADGKVKHVRWTATKDAAVRAFPEGVIDPALKSISFWNGEEPLVALTYYATHPQSYYRTALATPDFPGLARNARQKATGVPHVHFNGAAGNIGAGKYNDGAPENRPVLAERMAAGMEDAWWHVRKTPIAAADVGWKSLPVALPASTNLDEKTLLAELQNTDLPTQKRISAACRLAWLRRAAAGETIDISCLSLGPARVLHLPGELFVEYQLAAQQLRPDLFVAMAAYGDYSPWYIGTEISYAQGGYETQADSSLVSPAVEQILVGALRTLLDAPTAPLAPLGVSAAERETAAAKADK